MSAAFVRPVPADQRTCNSQDQPRLSSMPDRDQGSQPKAEEDDYNLDKEVHSWVKSYEKERREEMKPIREIRFKPYLEIITPLFAEPPGKKEVLDEIMKYKTTRAMARHDARMVKLLNKSLELLRRVYNDIEMHHLTDAKCVPCYVDLVKFHKRLGTDIFNFLQSQDEVFRQTTMRRQRRWRTRNKVRVSLQTQQVTEADRQNAIVLRFITKLEELGVDATVVTVHDSIQFHCKPDEEERIAGLLKKITEEVKK